MEDLPPTLHKIDATTVLLAGKTTLRRHGAMRVAKDSISQILKQALA
jgi:hypothetical protein